VYPQFSGYRPPTSALSLMSASAAPSCQTRAKATTSCLALSPSGRRFAEPLESRTPRPRVTGPGVGSASRAGVGLASVVGRPCNSASKTFCAISARFFALSFFALAAPPLRPPSGPARRQRGSSRLSAPARDGLGRLFAGHGVHDELGDLVRVRFFFAFSHSCITLERSRNWKP